MLDLLLAECYNNKINAVYIGRMLDRFRRKPEIIIAELTRGEAGLF
jgi:hypothetical protein